MGALRRALGTRNERGGELVTSIHMAFAISAACIVLGFVALVTQKIYLDSATGQPTEVEVAPLGKLKSNYPALVFVVFGIALAFYTLKESSETERSKPLTQWTLKGSFSPPNGKAIEWSKGTLTLLPSNVRQVVSEQGTFEITALIEEGKALEDIYEKLDYSTNEASAWINLRKERQAYIDNKPSAIKDMTNHTRDYQPIEVEFYPGPEK